MIIGVGGFNFERKNSDAVTESVPRGSLKVTLQLEKGMKVFVFIAIMCFCLFYIVLEYLIDSNPAAHSVNSGIFYAVIHQLARSLTSLTFIS